MSPEFPLHTTARAKKNKDQSEKYNHWVSITHMDHNFASSVLGVKSSNSTKVERYNPSYGIEKLGKLDTTYRSHYVNHFKRRYE